MVRTGPCRHHPRHGCRTMTPAIYDTADAALAAADALADALAAYDAADALVDALAAYAAAKAVYVEARAAYIARATGATQ